ncbi:oligosaccharide flippase family protein [Aliarcobacter butzleri]|uniref:lipopolysaccharide biosynthesis protein n=1 Tax=Aliarcobacter butzleri TaxID=28197 RepID=UPI002874D080|nr:oligosaccharide flippase family protein [Aliarcobacter butzleri]MDS1369870.1 oligosaccharide flippase family protein [Aliarcobacter butzleri]
MTKKLLKNSFIYVLGDVLNKSVPFFMLPVLTRYLTPEDYGIISVFTAFVSIIGIFTGLSIHGVININFFKMKKDELKIFIGNCLIVLNLSTFVVFILVYLLYPIVIERLSLKIEWLFVGIILAFAQFLTTINLLLWIAEQKPKPYSVYQISQTFTVTALSILLVIGFGMNWEGQLIATSIGTILFSVISFVFILKRGYLIFQPNKEYIKDALRFGVPLIPHQLAGWLKTGADRIVLMSVIGATATGIYAVGYQMGMIISVLVTAFNKAWSPYLFKILSNEPTNENKKKIVQFTYIYFVGILIFSVCFAYLVELFIPYFLGEKFIASGEFILYFAVTFAFEGMYLMVTNYIFYVKKTYILAYVTFCTAILHIGLLYVFIRLSGSIGAAQASMISFSVTFFVVWILSSRVYEMPWKIWGK